MVSVLFQPLMLDTVDRSCLAGEWRGGGAVVAGEMSLWRDPCCVPPILTWESSCGGRPNVFYVSDLCPHNIGWHSPHLQKRKRRDPHPFKQQLLWVQ